MKISSVFASRLHASRNCSRNQELFDCEQLYCEQNARFAKQIELHPEHGALT